MTRFLCLLLALITLISCNKDDTSGIEISIENLVATEITHDTAKITWQISTNSDSETVYTIFVNQEVIVEQLQENTYILENLTPDTLYDVKLVARTQFSNSEMSIEFRTLPTEQLYLKEATNVFEDFSLRFFYNDLNKIERKRYNNTNSYIWYYDSGKLGSRDNTGAALHTALYTYEMEDLVQVDLSHSGCTGSQYPFCDVHENIFYFDSGQNNYSRANVFTRYQYMPQGPPIITIVNYTYEASYSDGKLTSVIETNDQTGEVRSFYFEYHNGNLIRFDSNGTILEINYDDKKNWHTFESGYDAIDYDWENRHTYRTSSSLMFLDYELKKQLWLFPQLHDHINNNNPLSYSIDGEIVQEFEYEYNIHDYPTKFTAGEYGQILLEYY